LLVRLLALRYDPAWESYFEKRLFKKMQTTRTGKTRIAYLWGRQQGRCRVCGQLLKQEEEQWQVHHLVRRVDGGGDEQDNLELLHDNCHRQLHSQAGSDESDCVSREAFEEA
jgi:RNA-directed DNA polymerase